MDKNKEFQTQENGLLPFDPIILVRDVCKRWLVILVAAVIVGVAAYIVTDISYTPSYQTNTTLVVSTRGSSTTVYSNQSSATSLANVFTELLNSSILRQKVLETSGLERFSGSITTSVIPNTNLITIQVTAPDPREAFLMTRALLENHEELTYQIMGDVVLEVLQKPTIPVSASNSLNPQGNMQKAMLITAVLACLLLAYLSYNRDTVRSGKEVRKKLDCWYLGEIPHEEKYRTLRAKIRRPKTSILITSPTVSFHFLETIRKIRRRVEQQMNGKQVLMVVSLLENEGKSTVAVNMALAMAKKHNRVLLIDCDLRKPACTKLLNVKWNGPGVRNVLAGSAEPADVIIEDGRSGLHLLLEKTPTRNSGDLIGSSNMENLLVWARANYDFVVLDLPPMSAVTDAERMMELADGTLLVVRQNAAAAPALNKVIASLSSGKAKLLGCVLNNVYSTFLSSGQGHGSGYGSYGHYGRYGHYGHYGRYGTDAPNDSKEQG